jgi:hypothetical protein
MNINIIRSADELLFVVRGGPLVVLCGILLYRKKAVLTEVTIMLRGIQNRRGMGAETQV